MCRRLLGIAAVALVSLFVWAEVEHWRASWRRLGDDSTTGRREAVVVLGFRNRGSRANYLNRYRVRAGIRSMAPAAEVSVLVLCGGRVTGTIAEAELMEQWARSGLGFTGEIRLDRESRSTWENIQQAIPLIEDADSIKIVSNSLHAEIGRAYLWALRPDLGRRLRRGDDHHWGEIAFIKPAAALLGLRKLRSLQKNSPTKPSPPLGAAP